MAVYTSVSARQAQALITALQLGTVTALTPCSGGIENTNYFVDTENKGQKREYVLTLFERLSFEELPFYLELMRHLADNGIAVPRPYADADSVILHTVAGKPAAVVERLRGRQMLQPTAAHCQAVGRHMAQMHLAGSSFHMQQRNLRDRSWWNATIPVVLPHLNAQQSALILNEQQHQNMVASSAAFSALPVGAIHADLFRDNVMFDGTTLTGFFDFYFAGIDSLLFDIAVALNDWCFHHAGAPAVAHFLPRHIDAFLDAYQAVRPLTAAEQQLLPDLRRAAALRFWTSRLWDFYLPRDASLLTPHDPTHFERILLALRGENNSDTANGQPTAT